MVWHHPTLDNGVGTGCAGSQPASRNSSNLVVIVPKALFKKGVAALEAFFSQNIDSCVA
jgi:hypothetical protein